MNREHNDQPSQIVAAALGGCADATGLAQRVIVALREAGFVCALIEPTEDMLKAAWAAALEEDAAGVWHCMVEVLARRSGGPSGNA